MSNFNKVILLGNLTRDPETKALPGGTTVCNFGIAVNRTYVAKGEKRDEVLFVDCTAFGKAADAIGQYLKKGRAILVEGRLRLENWETAEGQKRSKHSIVVEQFQFIGSKEANSNNGKAQFNGNQIPF